MATEEGDEGRGIDMQKRNKTIDLFWIDQKKNRNKFASFFSTCGWNGCFKLKSALGAQKLCKSIKQAHAGFLFHQIGFFFHIEYCWTQRKKLVRLKTVYYSYSDTANVAGLEATFFCCIENDKWYWPITYLPVFFGCAHRTWSIRWKMLTLIFRSMISDSMWKQFCFVRIVNFVDDFDDVCSTCVAWSIIRFSPSFLFLLSFNFVECEMAFLFSRASRKLHAGRRCDVNFHNLWVLCWVASFAFFNWTNWILVERQTPNRTLYPQRINTIKYLLPSMYA